MRAFLYLLFVTCVASQSQILECNTEKDCPAYNSCFYNVFSGYYCVGPKYSEVDCHGINAQGIVFPNHQICVDEDMKEEGFSDWRISNKRCYKTKIDGSEAYRCGGAYKNACTPQYDTQGNFVKDDQCPYKFRCEAAEFKDGKKNICNPHNLATDAGTSESCTTAFDCGYSVLQGIWAPCYGGQCSNVIQ
ncbi:uncharacterized protein [Lepeophtheirus salmonis]|uniref:uncharacterized protein n=1 Tax=Lepeophtheirus salmonis TaxID=72036 RepID=UPI001AE26EB6|nr:uncharacterized protein LOC121116430 [Lepeophtheirus salmonis]XP_040566617.1 uncharacterized protein LOC121116430 [Lepeophtheirus salmonis]XP_040566618.1 uncharacterized protein LOC121116430 [Lepeophtheirus salmonis]XP_040566619.1 uncharacterized protein LOC121116430 [Lepeophtheirus salmonis]